MSKGINFLQIVIYIISISTVFTSCTHRILRTGYQVSKSEYVPCDIVIKKNTIISDTIAIKIGEIKLGETGFAMACSEEHAIKILKGEGCAIKADLIIITDEKRPDLWSSCYRCSASFYKYNNSVTVEKNPVNEDLSPENIKNRVSKDRSRNIVIAILAILAGIGISSLIFK
ncbi:MAG: hypothetical protein P1P88_15575 [Bacteroidales bacterium]|nr:hypothetical protein [Bacteroidales bacterium]